MSKKGASGVDLKKILANAQLPALPQSAIRLLELSQNPENGPADFAAPIESDPGLAGQVLRFVNSSYFGFSREISSVKLAITLVGVRTIKNFSLWSAVFSLMPNPKCGPFDLKQLWQDSLRRALFARDLSQLLGSEDSEDLFAAALLQDMAVPLLAKEAPTTYVKLLTARNEGEVRLSELEQYVFGWTHAEAGGLIARQWNFPDCFAELVEKHLLVDEHLADPNQNLGPLAVALSALLPTSADPVWIESRKLEEHYARIRPVSGPPIEELLDQIDTEFAAFAPLLKIAAPSKSLVEAYREVAAPAS